MGRLQIEGLAEEGKELAVQMPEVATLNDKLVGVLAWRLKVRQLLDSPIPDDQAATLEVRLALCRSLPMEPIAFFDNLCVGVVTCRRGFGEAVCGWGTEARG